ncbi:MAG: DUF1236 domain-containing protein [Hyphomicrobiales bacterium]|nr:DUF1236 domain-containing protein [Hyphomicrobiales bacterium]MBV9520079.1 DUF1236 domain-containing protein [Hyphomicrobiales bacterium]
MITLRTAAVAAALLASVPAFAQGQNYPRPNESQAGWTGNNYGNLYGAGTPPNGTYAEPAPSLGGGTLPGVVGGAAVGAAVGGPVGAVVGGVVGGTAGTTLIPGPVHEYVMSESVPSVPYEGQFSIGERWPTGIGLYAIPGDRRFGYAMVNNQRVVVNRHSHRIVEID